MPQKLQMECVERFAVLFGSGTLRFLGRTCSRELGVPGYAVRLEHRRESRRFGDLESGFGRAERAAGICVWCKSSLTPCDGSWHRASGFPRYLPRGDGGSAASSALGLRGKGRISPEAPAVGPDAASRKAEGKKRGSPLGS